MGATPIQYYNRYTGQVETEAVFGERFLRWTYETQPGRLVLHAIVKRALFSRLYGMWMSRRKSAEAIAPFIQEYGIDVSEFAQDPASFSHFNAFFARALKPDARPIVADPAAVVFPADGRHLGLQNLSQCTSIYAKGQQWDLAVLLQSKELAARYEQGSAVISRLCPTDYHRFHYPVGGTVLQPPRLLNGALFSVSPIALRRNIHYLWQNKRMLTLVDSESLGQVCILELGATCVGSIVQVDRQVQEVEKGELKGWFLFGGSCVITLFERDRVALSADLVRETERGRELYAQMGDVMAVR